MSRLLRAASHARSKKKPVGIDTDGDGIIDSFGYDTNGDGRVDAVMRKELAMFEKEAERRCAALLVDYGLAELQLSVQLLAHNGLWRADLLAALDDAALVKMGLKKADAQLVRLAAWLHTRELGMYGRQLTRHGVHSLTMLLPVTDDQLREWGVRAIGHRRQLLKHVRTSDALRDEAAAERARAQRKRAGAGLSSSAASLAYGGDAAVPSGVRCERPWQEAEQSRLDSWTAHDPANDALVEPWREPWRTTSSACLQGAGPGETPEIVGLQRLSEVRLLCDGGSDMVLSLT